MFGSQESAYQLFISSYPEDTEYLCKERSMKGYKVFLHTPGDVLRSSDAAIEVPFDEDVVVSLKPKMISTAEGLRTYIPSQRQCFFGAERPLEFFTNYTQHNCEVECLANYTAMKCGCVKFSMPS